MTAALPAQSPHAVIVTTRFCGEKKSGVEHELAG